MSNQQKRINYGPVVFLGLAMALGPLAALSVGSRYADEETLARANAGRDANTSVNPLATYGSSGATAATPDYAKDKTVVDVLNGSGVFETLTRALNATGLDVTLSNTSDFTLFAPSEQAFAKMSDQELNMLLTDKEALTAFIASHIIPGRHTAVDLMTMKTSETKAGTIVDIGPSTRYDGQVGIGGAKVIKTDLFAANGIVHVVDHVIE